MKAYSKERRREVLDADEQGLTTRQIAVKFDCSESWVRRVKQEYREQGKTAPQTERKRTPLWAACSEQIQQEIADTPDLTLRELQQALDTRLSRTTLCVALKRLKLTLKKKS